MNRSLFTPIPLANLFSPVPGLRSCFPCSHKHFKAFIYTLFPMHVPKCSQCGMPVESSNYYARGMTMKCRHCGHSALPVNSGACLYGRFKKETEPYEPFKNELSFESITSKLALVGFFASLVSLGSPEMRSFTMTAFFGFVMFGTFYGFLKIKGSSS